MQLGAALARLLLAGLFASLRGGDLVGLSGSAVWVLITSAVVGAGMVMNVGANNAATWPWRPARAPSRWAQRS